MDPYELQRKRKMRESESDVDCGSSDKKKILQQCMNNSEGESNLKMEGESNLILQRCIKKLRTLQRCMKEGCGREKTEDCIEEIIRDAEEKITQGGSNLKMEGERNLYVEDEEDISHIPDPILHDTNFVQMKEGCDNAKTEKIKKGESNRSNKIEIDVDNEKTKLFVCFRVSGHDYGSVVWYEIEIGSMEMEGSPKAACRFPVAEISMNFGTAALGSKIYILGGDYEREIGQGSSDVLFFDTRVGDGDYVRSHLHMLLKRSAPVAVATHGKIYVFGGDSSAKPWGEVFDPDSNAWSPLPNPPSQVRQVGFYGFYKAVIGDKILLCSERTLFSFDVKTTHWEMLTSTHPVLSNEIFDGGVGVGVGVGFDDNILFMYRTGSVVAYDFVRKKLLKVKGLGLQSFTSTPPADLLTGYVLRLAQNVFCLVLNDYGPERQVYVRCVRFQVATVNNSKGKIKVFHAGVKGRSTYQIPYAGGSMLQACFQM